VLVAFLVLTAVPAGAVTFTVNSAGSTVDANIGNGACADAEGFCTLRAAAQEINSGGRVNAVGGSFGAPARSRG
jgi:hypothetical protein